MIHSKLAEIQSKLFVPKGKKNEFGGFVYRSCEDILKMVKPLLAEYKCALTMTNEVRNIGESNYVHVTVVLTDLEDNTQVSTSAQAREPVVKKGMDDMQITGAASSYARKYALAGLFAIDNEKDSDADDNRQYQHKTAKQVIAERRQSKEADVKKAFAALSCNKGIERTELAKRFLDLLKATVSVTSISEMTDEKWTKVEATLSTYNKTMEIDNV
jgi:hypothetical protein